MIFQADDSARNPQTFARLSILGEAFELSVGDSNYPATRTAYLTKYPEAITTFILKDFSLFRIVVHRARYVAGLGRIYNLEPQDFYRAAMKRS